MLLIFFSVAFFYVFVYTCLLEFSLKLCVITDIILRKNGVSMIGNGNDIKERFFFDW